MRIRISKFFPLVAVLILLIPKFARCEEVAPGGSILIEGCVWPPYPGIRVTFESNDIPYSGFHSHHDSYRPSGSMDPQVAYTGADGCARSTFKAPDVAGQHE
jgi:hypothetical protein